MNPHGIDINAPKLSRLVAAIESLRADGGVACLQDFEGCSRPIEEENRGQWLVLNGYLPNELLKFCLQTVCFTDGLYFVESIINYYEEKVSHDYCKAGRKEPAGAVIHTCGNGHFKIFENEQLTSIEVIEIFRCLLEKQALHSDFVWRSIADEAAAFAASYKKRTSKQRSKRQRSRK